MARKKIPEKTTTRLWAISAGRCEYDGCNKPLWRDELSMAAMNAAYIAHIVAAESNGPRGDRLRSAKLAAELSNLMLLCDAHHRLVDKEDVAGHPEPRLLAMKQQHEQRIELLTSINADKKSTVVTYAAPIGETCPQIDNREAFAAIVPDMFPSEPHAIQLGARNTSLRDQEPNFWASEVEQLKRQFSKKIHERLQDGSIKHLSLFAIAPQPLLIVLGSLLTDIVPTEVFQRHREPASWRWQDAEKPLSPTVHESSAGVGDAALNISLSATIDNTRIVKVLGPKVPIWTVTVPAPANDCMKSRHCLHAFRELARSLFVRLKAACGQNATIHVFPAMPVSAAIEFGRVWMPKADLKLRLYDQNHKLDGFFDTGIVLP